MDSFIAFFEALPDTLVFPVRLRGHQVGQVRLHKKLFIATAKLHISQKDAGRMVRASVVSREALQNYEIGISVLAHTSLVEIVANLGGHAPTCVDKALEDAVDSAIEPLLRPFRLCAVCGRLIPHMRSKTCGNPVCVRMIRRAREQVRGRSRDTASDMKRFRDRRRLAPLVRKLRGQPLPVSLRDSLWVGRPIETVLLQAPTSKLEQLRAWVKSTGDRTLIKAFSDFSRYRRNVDRRLKKR